MRNRNKSKFKFPFSFSKSFNPRSKICFKSRRKTQETEPTYADYKKDTENKILMCFNIVIVFISLTVWILGMARDHDIALRASIFGVSLIALFVRIFSTKLWKLLVIGTWTALLYAIVNFSDYYNDTNPPGSYFLLGNVLGIAEFMIILSLKNMFLKIAFIAVNCVIKLVVFKGNFDTESSILFGIILALCVGFYFYYDYLERKNFKAFDNSREELRKFQLLLSKDFPTSVMIISSDLQSSLYSNDFFKRTFDHEIIPILSFLEKFRTNSEFQIDENDIDNNDKLTLAEAMMQFAAEEDPDKQKEGETLLASFQKSPEQKYYFEIRMRKIMWDLKPAYALVFNDTSDKQIVMTMKYADQQKDRVIQTLSHELKTPINGILGLVRIVKTRIGDQVSVTYLEYSESCCNLLLNFVNSILELSQLRQGKQNIKKDQFGLTEFLKEVRSLFLFQAEQRSIDFSVEKDASVPEVINTDKHRLTMILITLLGNAFKFTFKGSVTLKLALEENDINSLSFSVIDTGEGIKEEDKATLCSMFENASRKSIKDNTHGVGFGLTVSNELVKALNDYNEEAALKFESEYKQGTTFYFSIKINSGLSSNIQTEEAVEDSQDITLINTEVDEMVGGSDLVSKKIQSLKSHQEEYHFLEAHHHLKTTHPSLNTLTEGNENENYFPKNVLIVDDNPFNILAVTFVLEKLGCKVAKANNGEECLQVLEESIAKDHFELILMDIQMPILDGVEATKIITAKIKEGTTYPVPVVALTANKIDGGERERYLQSGMSECLMKPLKESELRRVLSEVYKK